MYFVCLCGFGRAGLIHYKNIMNNPDMNLKYILDLRQSLPSIQKKVDKNIIVTDDIVSVLNDDKIKIIIISTPTNTHYSVIIQSLKKNKHILCEKPISHIEKEVLECYRFAESNGLVLLCAFNRRFDPQIKNLKKNIKNIGRINQILTISRDYPYPLFNYLKISSGIFHDCAVHDIDFVNWILDDRPVSVYVIGNIVTRYEKNAGNLDNAIIIMEYPSGVIANLNLSRISSNYDQRIEIYGEKGELILENPYGNISLFKGKPISFPERYEISYKNEIMHLINVIKKKEDLLIQKEDCLTVMRIVNACELSFQRKERIIVNYKPKKV